jgi:hypothetical protein
MVDDLSRRRASALEGTDEASLQDRRQLRDAWSAPTRRHACFVLMWPLWMVFRLVILGFATGTADAPCYVDPADDKEEARLIVSEIIIDGLKLAYPERDVRRLRELAVLRETLGK